MSSEEVSFMNGKWVISNPLVVQNYIDRKKLAQISIFQVPLKSLRFFWKVKKVSLAKEKANATGVGNS